jgi:ribosomal protein L40E
MGQEDSVSVSASGEDAKSMMELLRNAGIGHGGAEASHDMGPEVTDQDEVLGQLGGQEHDDSGDTDLSFLKKMIGTPVEADCGCEEGQTQTASPGDSHMSPMANKMDEAEVEEGNLFTKGLEDDDVKIGEKIPGTDAIKTKDIGESDDLGPVKDTGGKCNMVHKTSGKEIVVRDEPDVIKKYEAMGYKKQVEEADDDDDTETSKSSTGGRIERKDGVTKHHAGKHYGGSEDKDDDDEKVDESYDSQDPTDVAGIDDERSEAIRDAGLAASYVPEEALDQPATFEEKSCMECGSPMEESAHECNECGYTESMYEDEVEESALQAYLGKKKYGEEGMKALQQAGREGAGKEEMAKIRAQHDKLDEEGYTFEGLFKKLAMIAEESTAEKDEHAEKAGKKVTKDIEYDEGHKGKDDAKAEKAGKKVTKDIEYDDKKDKEKVDEWANSPQNKLSDEEFQTEMNYMLQALSGGLNGPKVDNTTLPKTQVRPVAESESLDGWLRLAGIK